MKHYFVIQDYDTLRILSDPLRMQILGYLIAHEYTGKQIADLMTMAPSKIHYHLKELEDKGLVTVVRTQEKNGIVQKFYRAVAFDYVIDEKLLPIIHSQPTLLQDVLITQLHMVIGRIRETPAGSFPNIAEHVEGASLEPPFMGDAYEFKVDRKDLQQWLVKYRSLLKELEELDQSFREAIDRDQRKDPGEIFFLQNVGFVTPTQYFVSEDHELPPGYQWAGRGLVRRISS
ncbi:ArsR/SmtB family transcription factor [Sulfobacillus thermosulfidooxidans]|uniref:ArsR/SmtB family transcription factor n=1 Tax=Sulfobacillus thermosulfidooxidans TaxID=28034 RepID=UPI0003F7B26C|nr:winged helix-turn-helix domain-containing protein [Sulfobacillus thermosulfidooxidans]